jgi:hypothetical protein
MTTGELSAGYHTGVVNVLLLECGLAQVTDTVASVQEEIVNQRLQHSGAAAVEWLKGYQGEVWADTDASEFYNPRTYVCWGGFDAATVFLSPTLHLPALFRSGATSESGQHLHRGILPKKPEELVDAVDFNRLYLERITDRIRRGDEGLAHEPDHRFFAFAKLKLSGSVVLPQRGSSESRFRKAFNATWTCVHEWLGNERNGAGSVALAQSFGWSELMLLAHGASLTALFGLVANLRKLVGVPAWNRKQQSHQFVTTVTKLAFDSRLWTEAHRQMREPREPLDAEGSIPASYLVPWSRRIAEALEGELPHDLETPRIYLRPMFCAYPGHEPLIWRRIAELSEALRNPSRAEDRLPDNALTSARDPGAAMYVDAQAGTRDVVGPTLQTSADFDETHAAALLCLLEHWILRNARPLQIQGGRNPGVLNVISCVTAVGVQITTADADVSQWGFPANHARETPAEGLLKGARLNQQMYASLEGLIDPMRLLQIPYSRIDQIFNACRNFLWSRRHEVLWEDTLDFEPALLCLRHHLQAIATWWRNGAEPDTWVPWGMNRYGSDEAALKRSARSRLQFLGGEIDALLAAFRSSFYNRHLTGYMADEAADVNLAYRGSIHQLVAVTSILLDSVANIVLGPRRACLVTVADTVSPQIEGPCDVVVAKVSAETVTNPFLLDTIGHEVGHWLAVELLQGDDPVHRHVWALGAKDSATYRELLGRFNELHNNVFFGSLSQNHSFCELIADLTELTLLDPGDRERWTQSFLLRQLFEAPAIDGPADDALKAEDAPAGIPEEERNYRYILGPIEDEELLATTIERACHVWIALTALANPARAAEPGFLDDIAWRSLRDLRALLYTRCLIGQSAELFGILRDDREWRSFLRSKVFAESWLVTSAARARTWSCLGALQRHLREREDALQGLDRVLWEEAKSRLRALRSVTVDVVLPAIYLRHTVPVNELIADPAHLRDRLQADVGVDRLPWKATLQPLSLAGKLFKAQGGHARAEILRASAPRMLFYQRGAMVPLNEEASTALFDANADFIGGMMQLIPVWKARLTRGWP